VKLWLTLNWYTPLCRIPGQHSLSNYFICFMLHTNGGKVKSALNAVNYKRAAMALTAMFLFQTLSQTVSKFSLTYFKVNLALVSFLHQHTIPSLSGLLLFHKRCGGQVQELVVPFVMGVSVSVICSKSIKGVHCFLVQELLPSLLSTG